MNIKNNVVYKTQRYILPQLTLIMTIVDNVKQRTIWNNNRQRDFFCLYTEDPLQHKINLPWTLWHWLCSFQKMWKKLGALRVLGKTLNCCSEGSRFYPGLELDGKITALTSAKAQPLGAWRIPGSLQATV